MYNVTQALQGRRNGEIITMNLTKR